MKIDTNTPVSELCERLREICVGDCLLSDDKLYLAESADRLELLAIDNEDLRNQNHNNRVAAEARWDRIKRLEEAGDAMFIRSTRVGREIWTKAKEAKP